MTTIILEPMTCEEWEAQSEAFKYFHPLEIALQPLTLEVHDPKDTQPLTNLARLLREARQRAQEQQP